MKRNGEGAHLCVRGQPERFEYRRCQGWWDARRLLGTLGAALPASASTKEAKAGRQVGQGQKGKNRKIRP